MLDIGSRRSGKTTRLVNFVVDRLKNASKPALIITVNERHTKNIELLFDKKKLPKKYKKLYNIISYDNIHKMSGLICADLNTSMFFYDDIDLYIDRISPEWLTAKGYYTLSGQGKSFKEWLKLFSEKL